MKKEFKKDFKWGTASSGPQSEGDFGKKHQSIWDYWYMTKPERFHNWIGPEITSQVVSDYQQDVDLMSKIGLNSFRTSIQWSRLIDDFETGSLNQDAVNFYRNYFKAIKAQNIELIINLFHYDMPYELHQQYEGFLSRKVIDMFVLYAKACFETFGDLVDMWTTFNEPMAYAKEAYHDNRIYPATLDFQKMMQLNYNIVIANAQCVSQFKKGNYDGEIGIILDCLPPLSRSNNPLDLAAAKVADLLTNKIYLDPCILGTYPPEYQQFLRENKIKINCEAQDESLILENIVDFVGLNYYRPLRVSAPKFAPHPKAPMELNWFYNTYEMPGARMNQYRGWEIYPKAMYDIGMRIKNEYNNIKWYVSENGMGVEDEERFRKGGVIHDDYRIEFISEHLMWLLKVIAEGSNCFGYHIWTFVDNWSWLNGYKNRYGYVEFNLESKMRKRKKSAYWINDVIKENRLMEVKDYEYDE